MAASSFPEDEGYITRVRALLARSSRPIHSDFLVAALVVYEDESGGVGVVEGLNAETCVLTSAICAERAALLRLRVEPGGCRAVRSVYITSTADDGALVTPGLLCREFMCEYAASAGRDVRVVLCSAAAGGAAAVHALSALYPHPPLYHGVPRAHAVAAGEAFAARAVRPSATSLAPLVAGGGVGLTGEALAALHAAVTALAAGACGGASDRLYPIHLAAGALLSNGSHALARQDKCLEYGCTADAVTRLGYVLAQSSSPDPAPRALALVQCDQFGNCIAPSAPPRAWLSEHGHAALPVLVHDAASGELRCVTAGELAPAAPAIALSAH